MRALPWGTVGKPMAMAKTPSSNSRRLNCCASVASPSMTGMIGVWLWPVSKPSCCISAAEQFGILPQPVHQFRRFLQDVDRLDAGGHVGRGHGAGEEEGPAALAQPLDDDRLAGHQAADHAKGLAQRADLDIDPAVQAEVIDDAAPAAAQHAFAVRVVHHQHDAVLLGHFAHLVQRRDVAVHAEDAVA